MIEDWQIIVYFFVLYKINITDKEKINKNINKC